MDPGLGCWGHPRLLILLIRASRPNPGLLCVSPDNQQRLPPSLPPRGSGPGGQQGCSRILNGGARGAPAVMGCVVTQPQILFSFVERKKGVGVIYQIGFTHLSLGEIHVLRVCVDANYVCVQVSLEREVPKLLPLHARTQNGATPLPNFSPLVFLLVFLTQPSSGRRIWGEGDPECLKLRPVNACVWGAFAFLSRGPLQFLF